MSLRDDLVAAVAEQARARFHCGECNSGTPCHAVRYNARMAVDTVLAFLGDDERHLIQFSDASWTIAHPLSERVGGAGVLFDCTVAWKGGDPGVRGRFVLLDETTLGEQVA